MLTGLPNREERLERRSMLDASLVRLGDPEARRRLFADLLLVDLSWPELRQRGLVPAWAADPNAIDDPEIAVESLVDRCERHAVTADDLDRHIRERLKEQSASVAATYEAMLAESPDETSERRRLMTRGRILVRLLGPAAVDADRRSIVAGIVAAKRTKPAPVPPPAPGKSLATMHLLGVELENIRCFRSLSLDFSENGKPRPWTMLVADNGMGKTTILRAIVMALCDASSATSLMSQLPGELLRQNTRTGRIRVRLALADTPEHDFWAETTLTRGDSIELRQTTSDWFPRDRLFVCGYGAWRSGFGDSSYPGYAISDSVAGLFDPKRSLQNPELALRRIMAAGADVDRACRQIESVLRLPENSTEFSSSGLSIKGTWGALVPIGAIGDGYLATLAWLSDLLGWTLLYRPDLIAGQISAIVVIDEIEKHLHPRWQREIVRELARQFPDIQFIVATHSPLCAGGLSDLPEGAAAMVRLEQRSGAVSGERLEPYRGWTYDQIMTSSAFGLPSVRDLTTQEIGDELRDAHARGDKDEVKRKERELEARSVLAVDDEKDLLLQEKLRRDLEELQRRADVQRRAGETP